MKFVAITACPAGVAHTYMVAKAIEKEAISRGHEIRIEKQGTLGIDDELEAYEIAQADAVIFAVSVSVEDADRFDNKPIVEMNIGEALHNPGKLIDEAEKIGKK
ncbi:PTS fructose transporter subunit IIB [Vagococcus salmoninarum]|uniref:PTS fructose transporter subunit IIB n=1 Tax=Vagococcus salmoninarum TaxID=2739 RepID=UPI003F9BC503